jgi:hypothetical protein
MSFALGDDRLRELQAAQLIEPQRVFDLIRRSFSGDPRHILGELLQNAQRAGATAVRVDFTSTEGERREYARMTYGDNGAGLGDGPFGLLALLCVGASRYDDAAVAQNQSPQPFLDPVRARPRQPLTDRSRRDAQGGGDLRLFPACLFQLPGASPPYFAPVQPGF